jgi:hypothetical protein
MHIRNHQARFKQPPKLVPIATIRPWKHSPTPRFEPQTTGDKLGRDPADLDANALADRQLVQEEEQDSAGDSPIFYDRGPQRGGGVVTKHPLEDVR